MPRSGLFLLVSAIVLSGCTAVHDDLSRQILEPPGVWLVEPADLGLEAESFEIALGSDATLTGFWIPSAAADGRTVVLLHEETVNASAVHPYYTFLHDAGFHVLVLDPRGYGRSRGTPGLRPWLYDLNTVLDWLRARPEVNPDRVALFGTSMGSLAAMWAGRMHSDCCAFVFEHLPSIRDMLREATASDGSALSEYSVGVMEFSLPENIEPADNAPFVKVPALFLATEHESERDRNSLLRAYAAYAGDKDLWILPGTSRAPHAFLTHDGEYQRRIVAFLDAAFAGTPLGSEATHRKVRAASDGEDWYEMEFELGGAPEGAVRPFEACAVLADGSVHFGAGVADGNVCKARVKLPSAPAVVAGWPVLHLERRGDGITGPAMTPLARAGAQVADLWPQIEEVRHGKADLDACRTLADALRAASEVEPFHPRLEAELADVFGRIGLALAAAGDESLREPAIAWLQRCVAAAPPEPAKHFWPGPVPTYGFPQGEVVARAHERLQELQRN